MRGSVSPNHNTVSSPSRPRLLRSREAAGYLGVSLRKLESWVRAGYVPVVRLDKTVRRFDRRALDLLIEEETRVDITKR